MNSPEAKATHEFAQAAFDHVAQIVSNYGEQIIIGGNCTPATEECLFQLQLVASAWGYDASRIRALHEIFMEENANLKELFLSLGDHDD